MQHTRDNIIDVSSGGSFRSSSPSPTKNNSVRSLPLSKNRKMTKVQPQYHHTEHANSNVVKLNPFKRKKIELIPRTINQENYIFDLLDESKSIVFATGPAGSGKTMMAILAALKELNEGTTEKIIITRPAVGADDEKHGFLPGTIVEKLLPWAAPVLDIIKEYYSPAEVTKMINDEVIELAPVAFLRGRTFKNSFIIFDEAQNSTINSMKMMLTRIGENSKMIITGDLNQRDRKYTNDNGLEDFLVRLNKGNSNIISSVYFNNSDIQRHPAVKEVLDIYGEI